MSGSRSKLNELFLSIDDFWGRAPDLADALIDLDDQVTPLATQAFYSQEEDRVLVSLMLDPRRTGRDAVAQLAQALFSLRINCFELEALSAPEREHFHSVELPRYGIHVRAADGASAAVAELYRIAGGTDLHEGDWAQGTPVEAKRPSGGRYSQVRRKTEAPEAAGTRRETASPLPTQARTTSNEFLVKKPSDITADLLGPGAWSSDNAPGSVADSVSSFDKSSPRRIAKGSAQPAGKGVRLQPESVAPRKHQQLRLRFLRGERWLAGRIRYVSNREVKVASGAPLRLGDAAIVGISFGKEEVFVSGSVTGVDPVDSKPPTSPGFTVAFGKLAPPKADQLIALLSRARDAGVSLKAPPQRAAPRFPVSWPIVARTANGAQRAVALDVSWGGVYLDIDVEVGADVLFAIPLDNAGDSIRCRGKVVRVVTPKQAAAFHSMPGAGIVITHFGDGDAERYKQFLARIQSRCQRRVVVAASPLRARALTKALAAAGYAVTSSTDPNALAELADTEPRPPDMAIIDESLAGAMEGEMLRALFRRRNVPCLATSEEENDQARQHVDRLLSVESE